MPSALDKKPQKNNRMDKRMMNIAMQVLHEVFVEYPDTKDFIEERLEQKCLKENMSAEEVIYFFVKELRSKFLIILII